MQNTRPVVPGLVASTALALLIALAGCTDDKTAAARAAARAIPPPTPLEVAKDAYSKADYPKALDYFERAARAGDANAEYYVGAMYSLGDGARRDKQKALRFFESAAAKEQPDALYALGRLYLVGDGVDRDPNKALALFNRSVAAFPPGESKDKVTAQRDALAKVMEEQSKTAANTPEPAKK